MRGRILAWPVFMSSDDRVSRINVLMESADAALAAGDYSAAEVYAIRAQGLIGGMPNLTQGDRSMTWTPAGIGQFIANCRRLKAESSAGSTGIQQSKVTYARPTATDDYS